MDATLTTDTVNAATPLPRGVRLRQDLSGYAFIAMWTVNVVFQILVYFGILPQDTYGYIYAGGVASIAALAFLYTLSNNISCEIFTIVLIVIESFFSFVMPYALSHPLFISDHYVTFLSVSICMCVLAVYIWIVLISNNPFHRNVIYWLMWLPMPYVLSICNYWTLITHYAGQRSVIESLGISTNILMPLSWLLTPVLCLGYWRLSHAPCFSAGKASMRGTKFISINIYLLLYTAAIVGAVLLF